MLRENDAAYKSSLKNKKIWLSSQSMNRWLLCGKLANVIARVLCETEFNNQFLLNVEYLEKTNHSTIARLFDQTN